MLKNYIFLLVLVIYSNWTYSQANDCTDAIILCGNTPVGVEPNGVGFDEFSLPGNFVPPCYNFNNATVWFEINIEEGGSLGFDIVPENGTDDFDFAVYGPVTDCANLGMSIRCSSTNPQAAGVSANTGLNSTETDLSEGPGGDGNGYLQELTVNAGERYYLLVDRAHGAEGFEINLNGTAKLPETPDYNTVQDLEVCDDDGNDDGFYSFDLSSHASTIISGHPDSEVSFHASLGDANLNQNSLPNRYTNTRANSQTVYARITSRTGPCSSIEEFDLIVNRSPAYNNPDQLYICNASGIENYDLTALNEQITQEGTDLDITYYRSSIDAFTNRGAITAVDVPQSGIEIFFTIRSNATSCVVTDSFRIDYEFGPTLSQPSTIIACRDGNNALTYDFSNIETEALNGLDPDDYDTYLYESIQDRANDSNRLPLNWQASADSRTIYFRSINILTGCYSDGSFDILVVDPPAFQLAEIHYLCIDDPNPFTLAIASGFAFYEWSTGESGANLNEIVIDQPGVYDVTVYNSYGCSTTMSTEVFESERATITEIEVVGLNYPQNEATITVTGLGSYEFALDGGPFGSNPTFGGLSRGYHNIAVRDINGCGTVVSQVFLILDYPRYFTPNGDGIHDQWELIGLEEYPGAIVRIYNRYGKLLKELGAQNASWDGTYLDKLLQADDYWFELLLPEGARVTGHFSLIN